MPTLSVRRRAVVVLGLMCVATAGVARAGEAKPTTVADMLAAVGQTQPAASADLAAESVKLSRQLNGKFAGQAVVLDAGLIIQVITEGGGIKYVTFPTADAAKGVGRSLCHATFRKEAEADGKQLSPGDSASVAGNVVSVSAKIDTAADGKLYTHVFVTLDDAHVAEAKPRPKKAKAATTQAAEPTM